LFDHDADAHFVVVGGGVERAVIMTVGIVSANDDAVAEAEQRKALTALAEKRNRIKSFFHLDLLLVVGFTAS
jgi:hypothetical protein